MKDLIRKILTEVDRYNPVIKFEDLDNKLTEILKKGMGLLKKIYLITVLTYLSV